MRFRSGHRGRGGEVIGRASLGYSADSQDVIDGCTFNWQGSSELLVRLPMLIADEWLHYLRHFPSGDGRTLRLDEAKRAGLAKLKSRVDEARHEWEISGSLPEQDAPPIVAERNDADIAGRAVVAIVVEQKARRLYSDSEYSPK